MRDGPFCQVYDQHYGHLKLHYKNRRDPEKFEELWEDAKSHSDAFMVQMRNDSDDKGKVEVGI